MCAMESIICPNLKGSLDGALCKLHKELIREMGQADIDICLSEHFSYCDFYQNSPSDEPDTVAALS